MKNPNPNSNGQLSDAVVASGSSPAGVTEECSECGTKKGWVLHNVRYRATIRRFCTSCVLRLHPLNFCPICFLVRDPNTPPNYITCSICSSLSHSDCLPPYAAFSPAPHLCPPCASRNPNFSFFELDDHKKVLDKRLAAVLLCAATIAAESMAKAAGIARAEAERKVREAAAARKRAREALDRFVLLSSGGGSLVHKQKE